MMRRTLLAMVLTMGSLSSEIVARAEPVPSCDGCHAKSATYRVEGMTCDGCAKHVKDALAKEPGVKKVDVDLAGKKVTVEYDQSRTDTNKIRAAIEKLGYKATLVA